MGELYGIKLCLNEAVKKNFARNKGRKTIFVKHLVPIFLDFVTVAFIKFCHL